MRLQMFLEAVPTSALERGVRAAAAVFDRARLDAIQAATAAWDVEGWDIRGFEDPAPDDATFDAAKVWEDAREAALLAACPDALEHPPVGPGLELLIRDDQAEREGAAVLSVVAVG